MIDTPGLSPRVRGNLAEIGRASIFSGPIPAGAGEPDYDVSEWRNFWAYPRGCGGTAISENALRSTLGLSPRVRGNRQRCQSLIFTSGPIPAGAGEPRCGISGDSILRAYPRGCGGTRIEWPDLKSSWGLSPRVRGNRDARRNAIDQHGPIPAGAGEPSGVFSFDLLKGAYPRGCGGT